MKNKVGFVFLALVAFLAYTLGAKAGKARYKEISSTVNNFWNDPKVKKARKRAVANAKKASKKAAKKAEKRFK
ncbi:hypothetical protein [Subtercola boreus]|uniref:YtxH domain-containing protein n=1 Tax=Subtercola boreus TaxID=120213 RepID=A0A3E0WEC3_9MICO|nr:hypothetical protein [Subtercola boreus]RFA23374.1 hypothetical protein B7R24_00270 [Subtercola boreus]RFA23767.1 hypothetical protein B7R23_00270 [Subtercola boreus]RFA29468.1 hypothetical protein B7R25_00265 [Subtercola boreus]